MPPHSKLASPLDEVGPAYAAADSASATLAEGRWSPARRATGTGRPARAIGSNARTEQVTTRSGPRAGSSRVRDGRGGAGPRGGDRRCHCGVRAARGEASPSSGRSRRHRPAAAHQRGREVLGLPGRRRDDERRRRLGPGQSQEWGAHPRWEWRPPSARPTPRAPDRGADLRGLAEPVEKSRQVGLGRRAHRPAPARGGAVARRGGRRRPRPRQRPRPRRRTPRSRAARPHRSPGGRSPPGPSVPAVGRCRPERDGSRGSRAAR